MGNSASEITTVWRYRNSMMMMVVKVMMMMVVIIIIINRKHMSNEPVEMQEQRRTKLLD